MNTLRPPTLLPRRAPRRRGCHQLKTLERRRLVSPASQTKCELVNTHDLNFKKRQHCCQWITCVMPPNAPRKEPQAYPPTSLDFINRPNPVEPLAAPPKHPLHGSAHLHNTYAHDLRRLLHTVPRDATGEAASKRLRPEDEAHSRSGGNSQARDLPSLPKLPVRNGGGSKERRRRLPPTLSGLHQPPPNAGLLPSISVQQSRQPDRHAGALVPKPGNLDPPLDTRAASSAAQSSSKNAVPNKSTGKAKSVKHTKNKWSEEETADLLKGVAKFGIGSWTKILRCEEYTFDRRTALDLKDRFRVCCPEHYKKPKGTSQTDHGDPVHKAKTPSKPRDRKGTSELAQMGIEEPFQKSTRRSRHGYTKEEDDALLRGFRKFGKSWAAIQKDEPSLCERTSTDLRDRFRLRHPQEYAGTGLTPRPDKFPHPPDRGSLEDSTEDLPATANQETMRHVPLQNEVPPPRTDQPVLQPAETSSFNRGFHPHISLPNDVFFGLPADDEDMDTEPLTLDRGILDWAFETTKTGPVDTSNGKVDTSFSHRHMLPPSSNHTNGGNVPAPLPSLASITAVSGDYEQLELPSLMQYFSSIENDSRAGPHGFLSLEELLSQTS